MRYGSICSGIEAASVAWHPLGWTPAFFSEVAPFPCAVLEQRWPGVPNLGDMTKHKDWPDHAIDLLVGGTPCQDFSIAGLRAGITGDRGSLTVEFVRILERLRPRWFVFENVPGMLTHDGGRGFGLFLGLLAKCGYGFAYRVFDAQYFNLAQQRERVFVVGYLGDWRPPATVLFERESMRWDSPPSRGARPQVAACLTGGSGGRSGYRGATCAETLIPETSFALNAGKAERFDATNETLIAFDPTQITHPENRSTARPGAPAGALAATAHPQAIAFSCKDYGQDCSAELSPTLRAMNEVDGHANGGGQMAVAIPILEPGARTGASTTDPRAGIGIGDNGDPMFTLQAEHQHGIAYAIGSHASAADGDQCNRSHPAGGPVGLNIAEQIAYSLRSEGPTQAVAFKPSHYTRGKDDAPSETHPTLTPEADRGDQEPVILSRMTVRRLTPREYERLQGFADDYTLVTYRNKPAADGPRYKAVGNSMPTWVMNWIGRRIDLVEKLLKERG